MANQFSNRPPFCDFLDRYLAAYKPTWKKSQLLGQRVGIGRFDEWLRICGHPLSELDWQKLLEFHRFLAKQGTPARACQKSVQAAKHAIRWGIERGELPQKLQDIYTYSYPRHKWDVELPGPSQDFLNELEATKPGSFRSHRNTHRVFHTFLSEKKLTYRRLRPEHLAAFVKYTSQKDFYLHTRVQMCWHLRTYLVRLYQLRKISRHPDEIFPRNFVPKNKVSLPRPLAPDLDKTLQELLKNTDDIYYKCILLLRRTGIRIAELRKLEFDCIQVDPKGRCSLIVPAIKLGLERRVPLDSETVALIKKIQEMSLENYLKKTSPKFLVIGQRGTPPRYERYSSALTEICARLGVKKWINLHALRHTFATAMLNAGMSLHSLMVILGHKHINMTLIYAKITPEKIHTEFSQAIERMSENHIPKILQKTGDPAAAFAEINATIAKALDGCSAEKKKHFIALRTRLAKFKMELLKAL